jgi:ATP-dependent DNA helicase RecG
MQDLAKPHPMNRLLQGDVGSGKTLVALMAALQALNHGMQAVLLAPTEILAKQHYDNALDYISPLPGRYAVSLLTSQKNSSNLRIPKNANN